MWKQRPSVSHYKTRRVKPPKDSCLHCILFPPFNLNFSSLCLSLLPHLFLPPAHANSASSCPLLSDGCEQLLCSSWRGFDTSVCFFSLGPAMIAEQGTLFTHALSSVQGPQLVTQEVSIAEPQSVAVNRDTAWVSFSNVLQFFSSGCKHAHAHILSAYFKAILCRVSVLRKDLRMLQYCRLHSDVVMYWHRKPKPPPTPSIGGVDFWIQHWQQNQSFTFFFSANIRPILIIVLVPLSFERVLNLQWSVHLWRLGRVCKGRECVLCMSTAGSP